MSEPWTETCPPDVWFNGDPDIRRGEREPGPMPETCEACRWWHGLGPEDKWSVVRVLRHAPGCQEVRGRVADAIIDELGICFNPGQVPGWRLMQPDEGCELYEEEK